jgi:glycosyltransferase involved in cell wall biosynthesis
LLKKLGKASHLIYEPHELETERVGLFGMPRKLTKVLERFLIKHIDTLIVVSQPIRNWYIEKYGLEKVFVVQNMPYNFQKKSGLKTNNLKDKFKIPDDNLLFIYQGLIASGRGIFSLLDVFKRSSPNKHLLLMGYGPSVKEVKKAASQYSNIHYLPAVSIDKIFEYTSSADIGINYISGEICMSYRYSLPNKFGEYIISGLPVLVSSSLEYLSHLVTHYNCGWSINSDNPDILLNFIENVSLEEIERLKYGVRDYSRFIGWEFEEKKFIEIYNYK